MKKILIIAISVLVAILAFVMVYFFFLKETKTPIKIVEEIAGKDNYVRLDITSFFNEREKLTDTLIVVEPQKQWRIEMFEYATNENAKTAFKTQYSNFEIDKGPNVTENNLVDKDNYTLYTYTDDKTYVYVYRFDNNLILVRNKREYKDDMIKYLKKLGYYKTK